MNIKKISFLLLLLFLLGGSYLFKDGLGSTKFSMLNWISIKNVKASTTGDLIKMSSISSVYYLGDDNKRYVFPSESVYFSWYKNFDNIITIPSSELQSYPLGGNIVMRAGTRLVKITTDPAVYAVEPEGVLRKIKNEEQAKRLYGEAWAKRVQDVPDAFFTDYQIGTELLDNEIPVGALLNQTGTQNYYYKDSNNYRQITSANAFNANHFYSDHIIKTDTKLSASGESISTADQVILSLIQRKKLANNNSNQNNSSGNNSAGSGSSSSSSSGGGGGSPSCNGSYTQICNIDNGQGSQARTCSAGNWSIWSSCTVVSCNNGYQINNNSCIATNCSGASSQSCAITNGQGNQNRTCSLGEWAGWSPCTITSCNTGYQLSENTCIPTSCEGSSSQSCAITNGQGNQIRTCNLGLWSGWGACTLSSCNTGYQSSGNTCVANSGSQVMTNTKKLIADQSFAIPSNAANGDVVGTINTFWNTWNNRSVNYSITNGNGNFSINNNGKITLSNSSALSGQNSISINIKAEDTTKQEFETAVITIRVLDSAQTYYIDPTVSVNGNGTKESPYKNWSNVTIASNHNYLQKRGTEATINDRISLNGTNNVTVGAYGSAEARPKIIGWNIGGSSGGVFGVYGDNHTIRDIDIDAKESTSGIYIGASTNAIVDNCRIQNSAWALRTMVSGDGTKILNSEIAYTGDDGHYNQNHNNMEIAFNYIHHVNQAWNENSYWYVGKTEAESPGDGIQLNGDAFGFNIHHNIIDRSDTGNKFCIIVGLRPSATSTNGLLENNHCEMSTQSPIGAQGFYIERGAVGIKVRYNTFNNGRGIFTHAKDLLVAYNLFLNSRAYFGEPGGIYQAYNNVFYGGAAESYSLQLWTDTLNVRNNIFFFTNETATGLQTSSQFPMTIDHNLYYPTFRGVGSSPTNLITDPLFVNPLANDFRLQSTSPAIGAGVNVGESHDFFGNPLTGAVNMGLWDN